MPKHEYKNHPSGEPVECESCGQVSPVYTYTEGDEGMELCELCSCTLAGNAARRPRQYEHGELMRHVCAVGNLILDAVQNRKPPCPKCGGSPFCPDHRPENNPPTPPPPSTVPASGTKMRGA